MKISRENYEIWFTDWLDNNLTGQQTEELNSFLERNPDLKKEFNDLFLVNLKTGNQLFKGKDDLLRSVQDIPGEQFEILCAASAENDLDEEHQKELDEIISLEADKGRIYEIYKRLRLKPPEATFQNKKKLVRLTAGQKVYRVAWAGLSAAAVVALIFISGVLNRFDVVADKETIALGNKTMAPQSQLTPGENESNIPGGNESKTVNKKQSGAVQNIPLAEVAGKSNPSAAPGNTFDKESIPARININIAPLADEMYDKALISENITLALPQNKPDDERSNIGRFIAQRFRSKVLDDPEASDKPLKGYEIAEAGIEGLNKLLGWEMALTTKSDEKGEVKSLNFNSRMLKFNTPVKNNGSAE